MIELDYLNLLKYNMKRLLPRNIINYKASRSPYNYFISQLEEYAPNLATPSDGYDMHRAWEINGRPLTFQEALNRRMFSFEDDGFYHANSVYKRPDGNYEFAKKPNHQTRDLELNWYYSNQPDAKKFRNEYEFVEATKDSPAMYIKMEK